MNSLNRLQRAAAIFFVAISPLAGAGDHPVVGRVERFAPGLDAVLPADAVVERLTGYAFQWSEGPAWVADGDYLLFSDVPGNTIWKWSEEGGLEAFLNPSALDDGREKDPAGQGTNGLVLTAKGQVMAADHGSRGLYRLNPASKARMPLVADYRGKRFNSPNDLVISSNRWPGAVYFTDPPYGLEGQDDSPNKELGFNGVFRLDPSGEVELLDDTLVRPNGIGLSPDESTLYVASSDRGNIIFRAYDLDETGGIAGRPRTLADTTRWHDGNNGANDGFAVDSGGNLWATGPGGVFVITPAGEILGRISTGTRVANCTFGGPEGKTLYITSHRFLARIETTVKGLGF